MGRLGIQKDDVFSACEELIRKGIPVTVANVRQELGTGSYTTILPLIGEFQTAKRTTAQPPLLPSIPEEVTGSADRFIKELWTVAASLAEGRVKEIEAKAHAREEELLGELKQKGDELAQAHKDIQAIEKEVQEVRASFEAAKQSAVLIEGEAVALRSQLKEREMEIRQLLERSARAEQEAELLRKEKLTK